MDPHPDAIITDFMIWLARKKPGMMKSNRLPSGTLVFGPGCTRIEDLLHEYWEDFQ
jgi:hypothetical protein